MPMDTDECDAKCESNIQNSRFYFILILKICKVFNGFKTVSKFLELFSTV